jgi:hypothetical protein
LQFHAPAGSIPIQVALKPKSRKRAKNVFFDNRGFPDESEEYDICLSNIDGGAMLRWRKYAYPHLNMIDPLFN